MSAYDLGSGSDRCPWAPWTSDTTASRLRSFNVLVTKGIGFPHDPYDKALTHHSRVKLRKVRDYLAGRVVSAAARWRIENSLRNAESERARRTPLIAS